MLRKKLGKSLFMILSFVLLCMVLVSCTKEEDKGYNVVYQNGDAVIKTVNVKEGELIEEWDPTSEIADEFFGWYADPTFVHDFDFTAAVTEDKTIFGSFIGYQNDTRTWAIAGSGTSSLLAKSNWGKVFEASHYMTKESSTTKNVYKLTINLFVDDQFQFTNPVLKDEAYSWGHQRGAGYLKEATKGGVVYFTLGGGLSDDNYTSNITCAKDGKYEFVLTTYPKGDFQKDGTTNTYDNRSYYDTLTYSYLGEVEETRAEVETTFYIKGQDITSWGDYLNNQTIMVKESDNKTVSLKNVYIRATDSFMFASKNKDVATGNVTEGNEYIRGINLTEESKTLVTGEGNMSVLEDGYYSFSYNTETKKLTVEKVEYTPVVADYYIDGSFCSWGGAGNDTYKLTVDATNSDVYTLESTITLAVGDEVGLQFYNKSTTTYVAFYSSKNLVTNANFDTSATNIKTVVAGTYRVSFNIYSHLLTLTLVTE